MGWAYKIGDVIAIRERTVWVKKRDIYQPEKVGLHTEEAVEQYLRDQWTEWLGLCGLREVEPSL